MATIKMIGRAYTMPVYLGLRYLAIKVIATTDAPPQTELQNVIEVLGHK